MANSNSNVSVAVIGAGPLGLSTIKNLTDEGFDVKGFEARSYIGGVWKYSTDEAISVQESTVFNSSKYRSAFTDFPFAPDVADYPTWQQFHKYINDYADHYNVRRKVQLNSYIEDITYEPRVKKWVVSIRQKDGLPSQTEKFDKVAICNGYFTHPKIPDLEGVERFEGRRMHAINFHHPEQYKGKNVLVVGLHATSVDVAKMLVGHAKQVYLSHRNGLILVSRYDANNAVFDAALTLSLTRSVLFCMTWAPRIWNWIFHKLCVSMMKQGFPEMPDSWNFLPAPPAHITNPLLGDDVYPLMESGWAEPVAEIKQFTGPKSVELKDGRKLEDVDAVIYCTGYEASTSFLQGEYNPYPVIGQQGNLYRNIFLIHPDPDVRSSIAFIGHGGVPWPGLSLFELQGAAVAQVWAGKAPLASLDEMKEWHAGLLEHRRKLKASNPYESTHYNALLPLPDHLNWLDKTTGADLFSHFGWGWKAWKFWWQDRQFYKLCNTGIMSSAMWRLFETGGRKAWPEARAQIYKDNELLKEQIESRTAMLKAKEGKKD